MDAGKLRLQILKRVLASIVTLGGISTAVAAGGVEPFPDLSTAWAIESIPDLARDHGCAGQSCAAAAKRTTRLVLSAARGLGATLVEIPSPNIIGAPRRPHHAIGVRSPMLESALHEVGIDASHCLAPVVRLHTKLSSAFDLSGTLWVYARCSFR